MLHFKAGERRLREREGERERERERRKSTHSDPRKTAVVNSSERVRDQKTRSIVHREADAKARDWKL